MTQHGIDLLKLMFNEGETVCVSNSKYGYHSIPLEEILKGGEITLVPTPGSVDKRNEGRKAKGLPLLKWEECFEKAQTNEITLVALNPTKGFREDVNCYKYRNFLIEIDSGDLKSQLEYIDNSGLPYSVCVFSGSKSLHFLISLDKDLPDEKTWRFLAEWMLGSLPMVDQQTKNPTRSIRVPGAIRDNGGVQRLVKMNGKVSLSDLQKFLSKHPNAKPKVHNKEKRSISSKLDINKVTKPWVRKALLRGLDPNKGRNVQWFSIACEFTLAGFDESDIISVLEEFFVPDRDFSRREWLTAIKSGYKHIKTTRSVR